MKATLLIVIVIGIVGITSVGLLITIDYLQKSEYHPHGMGELGTDDDTEAIQEILDNCARQNAGLVVKLSLMTFSNDTHYIDNTTCEWEIIDDFDATFGGPGNRHPAFLGYYIPDICTKDMIKHLVRYSSMFNQGVPYAINDIGFANEIDINDFNQCVETLLENRDEEPSWPGR